MYTTTYHFEKKGCIILYTKDNKTFIPLFDKNKNFIINGYEYTDLKRTIELFTSKKGTSILPYYRYKIKDLIKIAKQFNIPIIYEGKKKTKKELYSEISNLLS